MQNFRQQLLKSTKRLFHIPESNLPAFYENDWDRPSHAKKKSSHNAEVLYRIQRIALTQARKPYRTGLLFTHDGMLISAQFHWRTARPLKVDRHISDIAFCATLWRRVNRKVFMLSPTHSFHIGMKNYPVYCRHSLNLHRFFFVLSTPFEIPPF